MMWAQGATMMWAQAPNDVGLCPNDVGGTAFALPPNDVPRGTPLPPARREYSKAKPRNVRRSVTIKTHLRQPLRPDYRRRAQTSAEFPFSSRRCIIILQEGENGKRKTKIQSKGETRSRLRAGFHRKNAICYERIMHRVESTEDLQTQFLFVFRSVPSVRVNSACHSMINVTSTK